jgi:hypothetical protein
MKTIICTAANRPFASLALDLVHSIQNKPESADIAIGILDTGLTEAEANQLRGMVDHVVEPGWDVDFRKLKRADNLYPSEKWLSDSQGLQAMTARPSLPKHFPGYDLYIWIDADCWLQEWRVIDLLKRGASDGSLCITAELDRAYVQFYDQGKLTDWVNEAHALFCDKEVADKLRNFPVLNSGVFALRGDSPLWGRWHQALEDGLAREYDFYAEQFGLNRVVYLEDFPRNILPATCNWLANRGLIFYDGDTGMFVEPNLPYQPLGIIHLSGDSKNKDHRLTILGRKEVFSTNLRYHPGRRDKRDEL